MRGFSLRLFLALCLLASTSQGFIAQTHVHARAGATASAAVDRHTEVAAPAGDEPACLLCDIAGHSPAVAPPVHGLAHALPPAVHATPDVAPSSLLATVASHHWRGRAPPDRLIA